MCFESLFKVGKSNAGSVQIVYKRLRGEQPARHGARVQGIFEDENDDRAENGHTDDVFILQDLPSGGRAGGLVNDEGHKREENT